MTQAGIYKNSSIYQENSHFEHGEYVAMAATFILLMVMYAIKNSSSKKKQWFDSREGSIAARLKNQVNIFNKIKKITLEMDKTARLEKENLEKELKTTEPKEIKKMREIEIAKEMKKSISESKEIKAKIAERKSVNRTNELVTKEAKETIKSKDSLSKLDSDKLNAPVASKIDSVKKELAPIITQKPVEKLLPESTILSGKNGENSVKISEIGQNAKKESSLKLLDQDVASKSGESEHLQKFENKMIEKLVMLENPKNLQNMGKNFSFPLDTLQEIGKINLSLVGAAVVLASSQIILETTIKIANVKASVKPTTKENGR